MPSIDIFAEWYVEKFYVLSNARTAGFAANPISLSDIVAYANNIVLIGSITEFISVIQELDNIYLLKMKSNENGR